MTYRIRTGVTLEDGTRLEEGDTYDGQLPSWLVDQGHVVSDAPTCVCGFVAKNETGLSIHRRSCEES